MMYGELLQQAITAAVADGWRCPLCNCNRVGVMTDPVSGEPIPDTGHWAGACLSLSGGPAAEYVHLSIWQAISQHLPAAQYGLESWSHGELVPG